MTTSPFRRHLLHRLLLAAGVLTAAAACNQEVLVEDDAPGGSNNQQAQTQVSCFALPACPTLDTACAYGGGGAEPIDACPAELDAYRYLNGAQTGCERIVGSVPATEQDQCCYELELQPCVGRPFMIAGRAEKASAASGEHWQGHAARPELAGLDAATRRTLAEAWTRDGLYEHASIASFGRFALELLAVGAPAELVAAAHRAALDEVQHARACLSLASAYAGRPIGAGAIPMPAQLEVSSDLADIAARAMVEGCIGETVAAAQAAEQLAHATDPAVQAVLAAIADEEASHAELAWRTVAWAIRAGGEPVQKAVADTLAAAMREPPRSPDRAPDESLDVSREGALRAHGRLSGAAVDQVRRQVLRDVIAPCAQALLARPTQTFGAPHAS